PWGHHFTSVILHGFNTCIVFFLFIVFAEKIRPGFKSDPSLSLIGGAVALIFGLHPLRVESVAWVSARNDLICGLFFFTALLAYFFYAAKKSAGSRTVLYLTTLILFTLALLSKPMAVTLPVILLLMDGYPLERFKQHGRPLFLFLEKLPFFILSLVSGMITLMARAQGETAGSVGKLNFSGGLTHAGSTGSPGLAERFLNAVDSLSFYAEQTLWPVHLIPYYPLPENPTVFSEPFIASAVIVGGLTALCIWMWQRGQKFYLICWLYYLVTIAPVSGLIDSREQIAGADRYTYISTVSFYFLAGAGILWAWKKNSQPLNRNPFKAGALFSCLAVTLILGLLSAQQIKVWKNGETLWSHVARSFPGRLALAHTKLGDFFRSDGQFKKAEAEYRQALAINPKDSGSYNNLGLVYMDSGRAQEAETAFKNALRIDPKHAKSHNNLGLLYMESGRTQEAASAFQAALKIQPRFTGAHNNFGLLHQKNGNLEEAEAEYQLALKADPRFAKTLNNFGLLYMEQGHTGKAEEAFTSALKNRPEFAEARNNLGLIHLQKGERGKAIEAFETALKLNPGFAPAYRNLMALHNKSPRP
ncbi:MAG: tetratricopeptide repeat protein, partial [Nitrospinaceae bacterium]